MHKVWVAVVLSVRREGLMVEIWQIDKTKDGGIEKKKLFKVVVSCCKDHAEAVHSAHGCHKAVALMCIVVFARVNVVTGM